MIKGKATGEPTKPRQTAPKKERTNADNIAEFKGKKGNGKLKPEIVTETVEATAEGQNYLPGNEPVVTKDKTLERLADAVRIDIEDMKAANERYKQDEEILRAYMKDNNVEKYPLPNGYEAFIEHKEEEKARVRKVKKEKDV